MKMAPFSYDDKSTPQGYMCGDCGASGLRLYRLYQTFLDRQELRCVDCACKHQEQRAAALESVLGWDWTKRNSKLAVEHRTMPQRVRLLRNLLDKPRPGKWSRVDATGWDWSETNKRLESERGDEAFTLARDGGAM
jgi:hypothetical protein